MRLSQPVIGPGWFYQCDDVGFFKKKIFAGATWSPLNLGNNSQKTHFE